MEKVVVDEVIVEALLAHQHKQSFLRDVCHYSRRLEPCFTDYTLKIKMSTINLLRSRSDVT